MNNEQHIKSRLSSFSIILIMVVLMVIGVAMIPLLSIQYTPSIKQKSLSMNFSWSGASARIIEQEVTSKLEGVIAAINGVKDISSASYQGSGSIWITLKKHAEIDNIRFEISSAIRRVYSKLPEGVSYPLLSVSTSGTNTSPVITYTINGDASPRQIKSYIENNLLHRLSAIEGVSEVGLSGANNNYLEILFDSEALQIYGISIGEIASAISSATGMSENVGQVNINGNQLHVTLSSATSDNIGSIPIANIDGRIVKVSDVAQLTLKEEEPYSYSRINGLNTINLSVFPSKNVNTLQLIQRVKDAMNIAEAQMDSQFGVIIADDSSVYIKNELNKIMLRTTLALFILLTITLVITRNLRYLIIIAITLAANLLIAFIFYKLFNIELHLYSLAGITVSLGIIIDTSIIMIDHYGYYHNRKVFLAILAALLTTIGALMVVIFLPEEQRANLLDFSAVIIINLTISMITALLFIPALLDKISLKPTRTGYKSKGKRRIVKFSNLYAKFISFGRKYRWAFIVVIILTFGMPLYLLPDKLKSENNELNFWQKTYNKTLGSTLYQQKIKPITDVAFGGTMRLFANSITGGNYYREPERTKLYINAGMPEGCNVHQLNDVIIAMENFLSQYKEIEIFRTNVYAYDHASIEVIFRKDYEQSSFPYFLKSAAISEAINFGGANWSIYGVGNDGFNNSLYNGYKPYQISVTGYNYDQLYRYASQLVDSLSSIRRVSEPGVFGNVSWSNNLSRNELFVNFNPTQSALAGISPQLLFHTLSDQLYNNNIARYFDGSSMINVRLVSDRVADFDIWKLNNWYIATNNDNQIKFPNLAEIIKRRSGNDIYRYNQQYKLIVAYDFIGPYEMAEKITKQQCDKLNKHLPMGYKAHIERGWWGGGDNSKNYLLLILVAIIIYFICTILFESLRQPLVIISLIPISFIGVFLIFYITGFRFDQGGFASFVLLSGLVVNAGIYIINEYNNNLKTLTSRGVSLYTRVFNHKIIPIMLTIMSTMLGLIPFLYDGESEIFWFSFAIGTIGGMTFSIIALLIYLPILMPLGKEKMK